MRSYKSVKINPYNNEISGVIIYILIYNIFSGKNVFLVKTKSIQIYSFMHMPFILEPSKKIITTGKSWT